MDQRQPEILVRKIRHESWTIGLCRQETWKLEFIEKPRHLSHWYPQPNKSREESQNQNLPRNDFRPLQASRIHAHCLQIRSKDPTGDRGDSITEIHQRESIERHRKERSNLRHRCTTHKHRSTAKKLRAKTYENPSQIWPIIFPNQNKRIPRQQCQT